MLEYVAKRKSQRRCIHTVNKIPTLPTTFANEGRCAMFLTIWLGVLKWELEKTAFAQALKTSSNSSLQSAHFAIRVQRFWALKNPCILEKTEPVSMLFVQNICARHSLSRREPCSDDSSVIQPAAGSSAAGLVRSCGLPGPVDDATSFSAVR